MKTYMTKRFLYRLGRRAIRCPRCGHKDFKPYVDSSGNILDPSCGRCNREVKCGYHMPPSRLANRPRNLFANADEPLTLPEEPDFIDRMVVLASKTRRATAHPLAEWFCRRFGESLVQWVFEAYNVVGSRLYGGSTLFWLTDGWQRVRSGKIMAYGPDGHRVRDSSTPAVTYVHALLRRGPQPFCYRSCLFGAHLRCSNHNAAVLLVESEKTALYLACELHRRGAFLTRYIPMATGGCGVNCDASAATDPWHRFHELCGARLVMLPDADATDKWMQRREGFAAVCESVRLIDLRSLASGPTDDIADILERRGCATPLQQK